MPSLRTATVKKYSHDQEGRPQPPTSTTATSSSPLVRSSRYDRPRPVPRFHSSWNIPTLIFSSVFCRQSKPLAVASQKSWKIRYNIGVTGHKYPADRTCSACLRSRKSNSFHFDGRRFLSSSSSTFVPPFDPLSEIKSGIPVAASSKGHLHSSVAMKTFFDPYKNQVLKAQPSTHPEAASLLLHATGLGCYHRASTLTTEPTR